MGMDYPESSDSGDEVLSLLASAEKFLLPVARTCSLAFLAPSYITSLGKLDLNLSLEPCPYTLFTGELYIREV